MTNIESYCILGLNVTLQKVNITCTYILALLCAPLFMYSDSSSLQMSGQDVTCSSIGGAKYHNSSGLSTCCNMSLKELASKSSLLVLFIIKSEIIFN